MIFDDRVSLMTLALGYLRADGRVWINLGNGLAFVADSITVTQPFLDAPMSEGTLFSASVYQSTRRVTFYVQSLLEVGQCNSDSLSFDNKPSVQQIEPMDESERRHGL